MGFGDQIKTFFKHVRAHLSSSQFTIIINDCQIRTTQSHRPTHQHILARKFSFTRRGLVVLARQLFTRLSQSSIAKYIHNVYKYRTTLVGWSTQPKARHIPSSIFE